MIFLYFSRFQSYLKSKQSVCKQIMSYLRLTILINLLKKKNIFTFLKFNSPQNVKIYYDPGYCCSRLVFSSGW